MFGYLLYIAILASLCMQCILIISTFSVSSVWELVISKFRTPVDAAYLLPSNAQCFLAVAAVLLRRICPVPRISLVQVTGKVDI